MYDHTFFFEISVPTMLSWFSEFAYRGTIIINRIDIIYCCIMLEVLCHDLNAFIIDLNYCLAAGFRRLASWVSIDICHTHVLYDLDAYFIYHHVRYDVSNHFIEIMILRFIFRINIMNNHVFCLHKYESLCSIDLVILFIHDALECLLSFQWKVVSFAYAYVIWILLSLFNLFVWFYA